MTDGFILTEYKPLVQQEWLNEVRSQAYPTIRSLSIPRLKQLLGFVYQLIFWSARNSEALDWADGRFSINRDRLTALINGSISGTISLQVSMMWLSRHMKKHWSGACSSENSLRTMRDVLAGLEIFKFDAIAPGTSYQPPELREIDFLRALVVFELAEEELINRWKTDSDYPTENETRNCLQVKRSLADLPSKHAVVAVELFNATFEGVAQFRRENPDVGLIDNAPSQPKVNEDVMPAIVKTVFDWKQRFVHHVQQKLKAKSKRFREWRNQQAESVTLAATPL